MKTIYFSTLFLLLSLYSFAETPLWMRYPAISPDGKEIAFSYKGDIYKVASTGGEAQQITMHEAYDYMPVWSPDGKSIAFASDRYGNFDIFLIAANGGNAKRLTTFSASEYPYSFTPDGKSIVFGTKIQAPATSAAFPSGVMMELYKISVNGGRPEQIMASPAENISFSKDGKKFVYQDRKGQEDKFRKHHVSSVTRNIWSYDMQTGKYQELISDAGEDTHPVFSPDNSQVYFLSERSGTYNVHVFPINDPKQVKQVSSFKTHPVRFLSIANNGTLCYFYDGEIYTQEANGKAQKVKINITEENKNNEVLALARGASGRAVSPDGKQVAFVMRGEIFVSSVDYKYTKRITETAAQDNYPTFSPDGKTLIYASERDGLWNLYIAKTGREDDLYFFNATIIKDEPLFKPDNIERNLPQFSPDGKEVAFIQDRGKLMVYNLETKKIRQITDGSGNLDSSGFISYDWSPDGRWFTISYCPNKHMPYSDIGLVSSQGGAITNLTNSGYTSGNAHWAMEGNAVLFTSERYGMRNHASWGSLDDAMIIFLNQDSYDKFILNEDDYKLLKEEEKAKEKNKKNDKTAAADKKEDSKAKDDKTKDEKAKDDKAVVVELKGIEDRIIRLTPNSSSISDVILSPEGDKLFYLSAFERGYDLWQLNCRTRETKIISKAAGGGSLVLDKDGKNIFQLGAATKKIGVADGKITMITSQAEMEVDLPAERQYMFDHVCMQQEKRFYNKNMHGVNWPLMKKAYSRFLPHINNNYDFGELLSEILGELNVSHTGGRYRPVPQNPDATAQLGVFFSWNHAKDGLLIDEVVEKSPFDKADSKVKAGCIIEMIDGNKILAGMDYFPLLNKKAGKNTLISLYNPATNERWEEVIKPMSSGQFSDLLYNRWVKQREADVERLSNGRLGYVHIQSMGDPSFRTVYSDILGKFNKKEAIVIDVRFNGGGRLHEDIEVLFSGNKYFTQVVRGEETCDMPSRRWNKPSIMVMNEACYSNAHGTPWVYKHTGIGKLVGMPVPGTMTSVSWENLQDPTVVFGIPIVGYQLPDGSYLENQQLEPDFKLANTPEKYVNGEDEQLAKAVQELLKELKK